MPGIENKANEDVFFNRKEIANFLRVSLVTLNDWVYRGLPSHKQRGRDYFNKNEVKECIKNHKMGEFRLGLRFKKRSHQVV